MNPHPRIRKTLKWGGLALVAIFLAAMAVYPDRTFVWAVPKLGWCGRVERCLGMVWDPALDPRYQGLCIEPDRRTTWWPVFLMSSNRGIVATPCWLGASVSFLVTATAWRLDTLARRCARIGFCPTCNYDRTGLATDVVCPECGKLPA